MQNRYSDEGERSFLEQFATAGNDLALRVYTSRLIGGEPRLVMHGGGNTSVKSVHENLLGDEIEALFVKGSGWDLDSIEPPGLPGLDLAYLRRLRALEALDDEAMVNELRTHLFDATAPNPSVETLLHAFLPHKFIDHSHAEAILTLTNQPNGESLVREALGSQVAIVPYVMPGFALAKLAADVADRHPEAVGLVLLKHGLFTWGESARQSYERHIELVSQAEAWIAGKIGASTEQPAATDVDAVTRMTAATLGPHLRGALTAADPQHRRWLLDFRLSPQIAAVVADPKVEELLVGPPLTPDHVIRTKARPLVLPAPEGDRQEWRAEVDRLLGHYADEYQSYFDRNVKRTGRTLEPLDPLPRVLIVRSVGVFAVGASRRDATIAADLFESTVDVKTTAKRLGHYEGLGDEDLFDVEYWSLEQAKLKQAVEKPLGRRVALVTGAAGAIGSAVVRALVAEGACVVACDIDAKALDSLVARLGQTAQAAVCAAVTDVTDEDSVKKAFEICCAKFGGIDLVILNAGIARSAPIDDILLDTWRQVIDVNLTGYFNTMKEAVRILKQQGTGGQIIINASKNVFAPGAEFAAYSASKAGGHQLGKLAAIELAPFGIRVNMINPDAVFRDGDVASGLWQEVGPDRARSRGLSLDELEDYYRNRNLLKVKVTGDDVARAVLFFAREETPTTGATLPVDGGVPDAFPR